MIRPMIPLPLLEAVRQDVKTALRPTVERARGKMRALLNDIRGTAHSDDWWVEPLREQWIRVLRRSRPGLRSLPPPTGPRILFPLTYGAGAGRMCLESILAVALRLRNADVHYMTCDRSLPACDWNPCGNNSPKAPAEFAPGLNRWTELEACRKCTDNITGTFRLFGGIPEHSYSKFLRPDDLARAEATVDRVPFEKYGEFVHNGVAVGEQAYANTLRSTLRGTLLDDPHTRWLFRRYLVSTVMIADLAERVLEEVRPERIVAVHGVYAAHGTFCAVARKLGVGVVVLGTPYRKGTIWLSHHDTYHRTLLHEPTEVWEHLELTPERAAKVDEYLADKRVGGRDYAAYHADAINEQGEISRELALDPDKPVVALYTNVLWDAQIYYRTNAFPNMLDWLFETIRYFARRPDLHLIIRLHPAEARGTLPTKQPLKEEIAREFPALPANVRVIPPESRISSYTLAEMSRAALIYGARMGVEVAILGIPLIIAGETFNRSKGYSYDANTREEYYAILDRLPGIPRNSDEMVRRARLYAYHFLYRLMIEFPLMWVSGAAQLAEARLEFETLDDLAPGRSPQLDLVCQGILDGKTLFHWD